MTENNQEVSIAELSNDDQDVSTLSKDIEEELKDITLDFDEEKPEEHEEQEEEKSTEQEFDTDSLFEDFSDFDE